MAKHYWTKEETVRVLELFLLRGCVVLNKTDADVIELAEELARDAISEGRETSPSPNSVAMKTANFMSLYTGSGLSHTSTLDEQIWKQYAVPFLTSFNPSFQRNISMLVNPVEAEEGKIVSVLHLLRERNSALIQTKKRLAMQEGKLKCAICGFDFEEKYGEVGRNFIEAHHTLPLAGYDKSGRKTRLEDLILVCSNCHRMLHRINKPNAVDVLCRILKKSE